MAGNPVSPKIGVVAAAMFTRAHSGIPEWSPRVYRHQRFTVRTFGLLIALVCAVAGDSQFRATAKVAALAEMLLKDPTDCWVAEGETLPYPGPYWRDFIRNHADSRGEPNVTSDPHDVEHTKITIKLKDRALALHYVPCPPPRTPVRLYSVGTLYHPFIALAVGGGRSKTNFDVAPPFDVNGSGFVFGISGGVLFNIPGTPISVGPRIGWQGANMSGSIENAPTGFLYDVKRSSVFYQEALLQFSINPGNSTRQPTMFPFVTASAGIAEFKLQFNGTSGAFQVTDSPTNTGFTGAIGFGIPIYQTLSNGTLAVFTEARVIKTDVFDVKLPGKFKSNYQESTVTLGFKYAW